MSIASHISDLLYRYDCVIVPNFGAFLAQRKSAQVTEVGNVFYPPSKAISFNEQIQHQDGLLASHIAKTNQLTYNEAVTHIQNEVIALKNVLAKGEALAFDQIGGLRFNAEEHIVFTPYENTNYLTESFGLSSFVSQDILREELVKTVEVLEEEVPELTITPEKRKKRPYFKYAAIFLLAAGSLGFFAEQWKKEQNALMTVQNQEAAEKEMIQEATFDLGTLPSMTFEIPQKEAEISGKYHVIAGAFRYEENAQKKMSELKNSGYEPVLLGTNKYGLHQVAYASLADAQEALSVLRNVRANDNAKAWLLIKELP